MEDCVIPNESTNKVFKIAIIVNVNNSNETKFIFKTIIFNISRFVKTKTFNSTAFGCIDVAINFNVLCSAFILKIFQCI